MLLPGNLFGVIVSCRREALALQEKCAQECTAAYRLVKIVLVQTSALYFVIFC